jgi:hypothetical protein
MKTPSKAKNNIVLREKERRVLTNLPMKESKLKERNIHEEEDKNSPQIGWEKG